VGRSDGGWSEYQINPADLRISRSTFSRAVSARAVGQSQSGGHVRPPPTLRTRHDTRTRHSTALVRWCILPARALQPQTPNPAPPSLRETRAKMNPAAAVVAPPSPSRSRRGSRDDSPVLGQSTSTSRSRRGSREISPVGLSNLGQEQQGPPSPARASPLASAEGNGNGNESGGHGQGLTLVHFSAQLEPCLTHKATLHTLNTPYMPLNTGYTIPYVHPLSHTKR